MVKQITCINCPVGCRMTVTLSESGAFQTVEGNSCPRGSAYAEQECTQPKRMITAVLPVNGTQTPLSVKTALPIPKAMIPEVMKILSETTLCPPVRLGQVIIPDILGTGSDIVATRNVEV